MDCLFFAGRTHTILLIPSPLLCSSFNREHSRTKKEREREQNANKRFFGSREQEQNKNENFVRYLEQEQNENMKKLRVLSSLCISKTHIHLGRRSRFDPIENCHCHRDSFDSLFCLLFHMI